MSSFYSTDLVALTPSFRNRVTKASNGRNSKVHHGGVQASAALCKIPETRRLLQEVENIKRRGRRETALRRDEEERYHKRHATVGEKENREGIAAGGGAATAPKPQNPTGSTAEDVSTLASWSRPPTSSMGADATVSAGASIADQKRKKRSRDGIVHLLSRRIHRRKFR